MIYQMKDIYINLDKLEYVSEIKGISDPCFQYQINGTMLTTDGDEFKERDNLIKAWKAYREKK